VTCKINEGGAITNAEVERAFTRHKVAVMVGDWTRGDPEITRFLEAHGRSGVPLYLYSAPGAANGQVLPQLLTPGSLTALAGA
jgi:thiol:disulfide interchange protein